MKTENLDKVIALLNGLGDKSADGFIWYLATDFAGSILVSFTFIILAFIVYKLVFELFTEQATLTKTENKANEFEDHQYRIANVLGVYTVNKTVSERQEEIIKEIKRLQNLTKKVPHEQR